MKYLILSLLIFLSGCTYFGHQSTCRRKIEYLEQKCQDCIDTMKVKGKGEATLPEKKIDGSIALNKPDAKIDSVINEFTNSMQLILNSSADCEKQVEQLQEQLTKSKTSLPADVKNVVRNNKYVVDTLYRDTLGIQIKFWQQSGKINYSLTKKAETISVETEATAIRFNCPDCVPPEFYEDLWFWIWISTLLLLLSIGLFMFKMKAL